MHYKTNRLNHDFQIAYFLAGACHTPDAAYSLLCDLREDRRNALNMYEASKLKQEARRIRAQLNIDEGNEPTRLEALGDLAEMQALSATVEANYKAGVAELKTIELCIERLQPLRKYGHLPDAEAHEAAQYEEWKLQLIHNAENHLFTTGGIPTEQFATMRMHPAFTSEILPAIENARNILALHASNPREAMEKLESGKEFKVHTLLGPLLTPLLEKPL